jgi:hypothetical protein
MIGGRARKPRRGGIAKRARNKWIDGGLRNERITRRGGREVRWLPGCWCRRKWRNSGPRPSRRFGFVVWMVAIVRLRISRGRIHHKSVAKSVAKLVVTRETGS